MSKQKPVSVKREKMINKYQSTAVNSILQISHCIAQIEHMKTYPSKFLLPAELVRYQSFCDSVLSQLREATSDLRQFNAYLGDCDLQAVPPSGPVQPITEKTVGPAVTQQIMTQKVFRDKNGKFAPKPIKLKIVND